MSISSSFFTTLFLCIGLVFPGCGDRKVAKVDEQNAQNADFGGGALTKAIVLLSEDPKNPDAYHRFATKLSELRSLFNATTAQNANLRLNVAAVPPLLEAAQGESPKTREKRTRLVWPQILEIPLLPEETGTAYITRLCSTELALACHHVVPEYWYEIVEARVWRQLKSNVEVGLEQCRWCDDDPSFGKILAIARKKQREAEIAAEKVKVKGALSAWPRAGKNAEPLSVDTVFSFNEKGDVLINDKLMDQNWRDKISPTEPSFGKVGIHLRPEQLAGEFLRIMRDARKYGYQELFLVTRRQELPYSKQQYRIQTSQKSFATIGVQNSDTVQVLVQALDFQALQAKLADSAH